MNWTRIVVAVAAVLLACDAGSPEEITAHHKEMVAAIEAQGFKDVLLTDYGAALGWEGCDENDSIVANAKATNAFGQRVTLIACSGVFFKGVTVRTR